MCLRHNSGIFRQLVEEQHAIVRQRRLARLGPQAACEFRHPMRQTKPEMTR